MTFRAVVLRCVAIFGVAVLVSVALAMQEMGLGLRPNDEGVHFFNQHALEDPILAAANQAVTANEAWANEAEFDPPQKNLDGTWTVIVWRHPKTHGGERLIWIDGDGKLKDYIRGK
jgi:hypothetical protein